MPLKNLSIRRLAAPLWGKRGRITAAFQQDRTGVHVCVWGQGWQAVWRYLDLLTCANCTEHNLHKVLWWEHAEADPADHPVLLHQQEVVVLPARGTPTPGHHGNAVKATKHCMHRYVHFPYNTEHTHATIVAVAMQWNRMTASVLLRQWHESSVNAVY